MKFLKDARILIVEDDPIIAMDLRGILQQNGLKVAGVAKNATRAFDILGNHEIDLAIIDIHLGSGPSGIDVAEVIHEKYEIPYIFLTSFSDPDTLAAAQEQGPYGYLVKPFQDKTLLTTLLTAWNQYSRMDQYRNKRRSDLMSKLTPQEQAVCMQLVAGKSYRQCCDSLFISMNTLKFHVKNIYQKLELGGRSELTALFVD